MKRLIFILNYLLICSIVNGYAANSQGLHNPLYIIPAWNLNKGDLTIHAHSKFYFKNEVFEKRHRPTTACTYWDAQGAVNMQYGIGQFYEIAISQIVYQDNHKSGKGFNLPDDLFLKFKYASLGSKTLPINYGVMITSRLPLAEYHNLPFEPYAGGNIEFAIHGLLSHSSNLLFPEDAMNLHLNLGFIHHNDKGEVFSIHNIKYKQKSNSKQFVYGLALVYPIAKFDFSLEFYGNRLIKKPNQAVFSRYNYSYLTPGITYRPYYWMAVIFGMDIRTSSGIPESDARRLSPESPVYPGWRLNFGVKINLMAKLQRRHEKQSEFNFLGEKKPEKTIYDQITEERQEIESAEMELARIKEERRKMDEMLKRLRNVLEFKEDETGKE
ncbi:hypothetical protein GF337_08740 [candidate division KSB1 bacterium]|nr:hypothetical protein [candidate division KSB1 bacterium]